MPRTESRPPGRFRLLRRAGSGGPRKWREMPVIALAAEVEVEAEGVDMGFLRARQRKAAVGRVPGIVDVIRVAAAVARGDAVDLERHEPRDRDPASQAGDDEIDWLKRDPAEIADQVLPDYPRGPAGLAARDRPERLALIGACGLVDD